MKHLHYVEIENFKRYGKKQRIELDHPAVLIGPNNCGKTSVLQAIALWSIGLFGGPCPKTTPLLEQSAGVGSSTDDYGGCGCGGPTTARFDDLPASRE
jgi:hypothetical protein